MFMNVASAEKCTYVYGDEANLEFILEQSHGPLFQSHGTPHIDVIFTNSSKIGPS